MEFNNVIKSISYNQHEILYNIMQLYNDGKPFDCDMTYSKGKFYGNFNIKKSDGTTTDIIIPEPKYKFDVCPQTEDTIKIEPLGNLPLEDESIESIVVDLPFIISPPNAPSMKDKSKGNNLIAHRFSSYYPIEELFKSYAHWIKEAYRILKPNGTMVFKTQANISGGVNVDTPCYSKMCASKIGFTIEDDFVLTAKARLISGKIKKQVHSRKFHSHFIVFKKFTSSRYNKVRLTNIVDKYFG